MEDSLMKKITILLIATLAVAAVSCNKEMPGQDDNTQIVGKNTLVARFAEETKTAFVGGTYMWKKNDNMVVRSDNANGYTTYKYTGDDTAGEVEFVPNTDDNVVYGQNSFAIYPAKTSGTYPKEEDGSLKPVLKDTYTWSEGNVEAPMLARVEAGQPLEFKHLGGCLKVTYKNVPPKATKIVVMAPVTDPDLIADGKVTYKINSTMNRTYNWTTAGGGFDPVEVPYVKAYDHSGTYKTVISLTSATAAERTSADGITAYIPLPVGPEVVGGKNVYPQLDIWLAFADNTEVPGSKRSAANVEIERAHIKPMPAITLTKYSVSVLAGVDGSKAADAAGKFNNIRGLARMSDGNLIIMESAGSSNRSLRFVNVSDGSFTTFRDNTQLGDPWHGAVYGSYLYFTDKSKGKVWSMDLTSGTKSVTEVKSGLSQAMDVKFDASGNAYVLLRDTGVYKYEGGFSGSQSVFAPLASFGGSGVTLLGMQFDPAGNLIVGASASAATNTNGFKLYKVDTSGNVSCIAGSGAKAANYSETVDGAALSAKFTANLQGLAFDASGNLYITDNIDIRKITVSTAGNYDDAVVTTILGGGTSYTNAVGAVAAFSALQDIIFSADYSTIYVTDQGRGTLRKITIE